MKERIIFYDSVTSANALLKEKLSGDVSGGTAICAFSQTAGRGRSGREFVSPDGGVYFSYLLKTDDISSAAEITGWTAVTVCRAIADFCGVEAQIKWVNDIVLNGKKVCGILTEAVGSDIIIGIGVNLNGTAYNLPPELREKAGYISEITGNIYDRREFAGALLNLLDRLVLDFPAKRREYIDEYRKRCITAGRDVVIVSADGEIPGRAIEINDDFSVKVVTESGGIKDVSSGEVSLRGENGYI